MTKKRDAYFDNAKSILIILVVLGHFLEPLIQTNYIARCIFIFIYLFHMPAFVFLSGYFIKVNKDRVLHGNLLKSYYYPISSIKWLLYSLICMF